MHHGSCSQNNKRLARAALFSDLHSDEVFQVRRPKELVCFKLVLHLISALLREDYLMYFFHYLMGFDALGLGLGFVH